MKWFKLEGISKTDQPFLKKVKVNGKSVCVVNYNSEIFVTGTVCPHAGADLSGGWCRNGQLICPFHRYSYDIKSGKGAPGQNDFIDTYPTKITEDGVYVGMYSLIEKVKKAFNE